MNVIPPEERVNMSLDDLIKAQNKNKKANKKKTTPRKNVKGEAGAKTTPKKVTNVAKSVGGGKAKRSAAADQRRGLNATGKATNVQVKRAVNNASAKATPRRKALGKVALNKPKAALGLKISFKPAELNKTTDKDVAAQIRGALSKQRGPGGRPPAAAQGRKVLAGRGKR